MGAEYVGLVVLHERDQGHGVFLVALQFQIRDVEFDNFCYVVVVAGLGIGFEVHVRGGEIIPERSVDVGI